MPAVEARAAGKLNIAPRWGGQLDLIDDTNGLLIDGKEVQANPKSMYWESKSKAIWFKPSIDDAVEKLRYSYQHYEEINKNVESQREMVYETFSWDNVVKQFLSYCS